MSNIEKLYWITIVQSYLMELKEEGGDIPDEALEAVEDAQEMFAMMSAEEASDQNERRLFS